ncbi:MAG: 30S ribosomal protein S17 [Patescibacteria group bacterium]
MEDNKKVQHRNLKGTVVSDKMNKTVVVRVDSMKSHPKYGKRYSQSSKFHVHDEKGESHVGDVVRFEECRPLSKTKCWRLVEILEKASV